MLFLAYSHRDLDLWPLDAKLCCIHLCECIMRHWCKLGENVPNTLQYVMLTMFWTQTRTHGRRGQKQYASGHTTWSGGIKMGRLNKIKHMRMLWRYWFGNRKDIQPVKTLHQNHISACVILDMGCSTLWQLLLPVDATELCSRAYLGPGFTWKMAIKMVRLCCNNPEVFPNLAWPRLTLDI